jgi:hypothetical protein
MSKQHHDGGLTPLFAIDIHPQLKLKVEKLAPPAEPVKTTPGQERLVDAAAGIRQDDNLCLGYLSPEMILCTLPHSDPGSIPIWGRKNRNLTLSIQPFWDFNSMTAYYPYGAMPRVVLVWMVSQIVKTRERRLVFGPSFNDLMREIGLDPSQGGGQRSDRVRLGQQLERLSRAVIRYDDSTPERKSWKDIIIAPKGKVWWDEEKPQPIDAKKKKWPGVVWWERVDEGATSYIEFSQEFVDLVLDRPVPLDIRIAAALSKSPLAMDLYAWFSYTSYTWGRRTDMPIRWQDLHNQLGCDYKELRQFRFQVNMLLPRIMVLYPDLKVDASDEERLIIKKGSRSSIAFPGFRKRERVNGVDKAVVREGVTTHLKKSTE